MRPKEKLTNADQLKFFVSQLALQTDCDRSEPADWLAAFARLDGALTNRKTVVLLDEISWMGHYDVTFPEVLKVAWDNFFSRRHKLVLVACGCVSMWIRKNITDNGAFAGRRSYDFVVPELPLKECVKFWGRRLSPEGLTDVLDVLSVTGGVPKYLEEVKSVLSADENIRRMAFKRLWYNSPYVTGMEHSVAGTRLLGLPEAARGQGAGRQRIARDGGRIRAP